MAYALDPEVHYRGIYSVLGQSATLDIRDSAGAHDITVIDKTEGLALEAGEDGRGGEMMTVKPAVAVRMSELAALGITRAMLPDAALHLAGTTWRVEATLPKPFRSEAQGELYLLLTEDEAT